MTRLLLAFFALLFVGSLVAFLLFVPPLLIMTVLIATIALLLTGMMLLYCFGANVELQIAPHSDRNDNKER
jgi:hypothetical protein